MDEHTNIPPSVKQAMDQHVQQYLPSLTKQYMGNTPHANIPLTTQQSIARELQKTMPPQMAQYANAYVSQSLAHPDITNTLNQNLPSKPPVPETRRLDHSLGFGEQFTTGIGQVDPPAQELPSPMPAQPAELPPQPQPNSPGGTYDFIMSPEEKRKSNGPGLGLPNLGSQMRKILIGAGAFFLIIIIIAVAGGSSGNSNSLELLAVVQDQVEILHLTSSAAQEPDISSGNQNFVATTNLVVGSSSSSFITYFQKNNYKFSQKQLDLRISTTIDADITSAESAGTFNQTFTTVMASQLSTYENDLNRAYNVTKGVHGRALLVSDYKQVKLLQTLLSS